MRTKLGRDEIQLPRTKKDHGDLASALAAVILDFEISTAGDVNARTGSAFEQPKPRPPGRGMAEDGNGHVPVETLDNPALRSHYFKFLNAWRNAAYIRGEQPSEEGFLDAWREAARKDGLL